MLKQSHHPNLEHFMRGDYGSIETRWSRTSHPQELKRAGTVIIARDTQKETNGTPAACRGWE